MNDDVGEGVAGEDEAVRATEKAAKRGRLCAWWPWILATFLVILSVGLDGVPIDPRDELAEFRFGWPIGFVVQNQSTLSPPLPWGTNFQIAIWEKPARILPGALALNIFVVGSILRFVANRWSVQSRSGPSDA